MRTFCWMLPTGAGKPARLKMHMPELGMAMMKDVLKGQNILSLQALIILACKSTNTLFI